MMKYRYNLKVAGSIWGPFREKKKTHRVMGGVDGFEVDVQ